MRTRILLPSILVLLALPLVISVPNRQAAVAAGVGKAGMISDGGGSGKADSAKADPVKADPAKADLAKPNSTKEGSAKEGSAKEELGLSNSAKEGSASQDPASSSSAQNGEADVYASPFGNEPRPDPVVGPGGYLENGWLIWEELMPADWDPVAIFEELSLNDMADDDPRIEGIIDDFVAKWNASPVNPEVDRVAVKIPGFVVPLDFEADKVAEFFLVPFFGACIHVPPPPPNQIVMVRLGKPMSGLSAMEVVWVYGKISVEGYENDLGRAGYTLAADKVELYQLGEDDG